MFKINCIVQKRFKNSQLYLRENGMAEILDVKHCLNFSNNVLLHLDYHTYKPISFVQPKKDFHCEAIYKLVMSVYIIIFVNS